jgi:hypothetical protein
MSAGLVGGGGTWELLTVRSEHTSEGWEARWWVWNQAAPEQRIWKVEYTGTPLRRLVAAETPQLTVLSGNLAGSLEAIIAFSREHNLSPFTEAYEKALVCLNANKPDDSVYHKDLAPPGILKKEAQVLLDVCQLAWQFGGMGSWNDVYVPKGEEQRFTKVSEDLFSAINQAIIGAVNSTAC